MDPGGFPPKCNLLKMKNGLSEADANTCAHIPVDCFRRRHQHLTNTSTHAMPPHAVLAQRNNREHVWCQVELKQKALSWFLCILSMAGRGQLYGLLALSFCTGLQTWQ